MYAIGREELLEIRRRFADERRTVITSDVTKLEMEDLIADEDIVITLTHHGYIKRLPMDTYKSQKRGGRGVTGMQTKEEDFVEHMFVATTHHNILFFTNRGKVYRVKGYDIPEASRQAKGTAMVNLVQLEAGEKVNAVIPVRDFNASHYLLLATRGGIIKKTDLSEYDTVRKGGLIALTLDEGDELIGVKLTDGQEDILLGTKNGMAIRFHEGDVRSMGRTARGVKGITLRESDEVVGMVSARDNAEVLVVTEEGYGKRTHFGEFRPQARGGVGIKMINLTKRGNTVAGLKAVTSGSEIMLITINGIVIRTPIDDISLQGRAAQGVTVMRLEEGDKVGAIAHVIRRDDEE
jgi:DNA gyrase subunit A